MIQARPSTPTDEVDFNRPRRRLIRAWHVAFLWLVCMAPFAGWGLPTHAYDPYLFGGQPPWPADRFALDERIEQRQQHAGGADADLDPIAERSQLVNLTATDTDRSAILLRYRLYSRQPDEMITFQALQRMHPRELDFDPHLYQYGGAFIYTVGAAIGLTSVLGITELSSDPALYINHPESFARFYIVARIIVLVFGMFLLIAAVKLGRRFGGRSAGRAAFFLVAASPVFISGVLEAKPHLPATCLLLWATLSAMQYHARQRTRDAMRMGIQVGFALALVPTGLAGMFLWPALLIAKPAQLGRRMLALLFAAGLMLLVYCITNPYVPWNLLFNPAALTGNIGNSTAMYSLGQLPAGLFRCVQLLIESVGPGVFVAGLCGAIWLCSRRLRLVLIGGAAAVAMLALCVVLGAGKPAEFARFLLLPSIAAALFTAALIAMLAKYRLVWGVALTLVALVLMNTPAYLRAFYLDSHYQRENRLLAAEELGRIHQKTPDAPVAVTQEPAPYSVPPLDFAHGTVVLLPPVEPDALNIAQLPPWLVLTADDRRAWRGAWWNRYYELVTAYGDGPLLNSRITWANKPTYLFALRDEAVRTPSTQQRKRIRRCRANHATSPH